MSPRTGVTAAALGVAKWVAPGQISDDVVCATATLQLREAIASKPLGNSLLDDAKSQPNLSAMAQVRVTNNVFSEHPWVIAAVIALIALIVISILGGRTVVRRRKDVRGLVAILRRNGEQMGIELRAPSRSSDTFRFIIRDEAESIARLDFPQGGFPTYRVKRSRTGEVRVTAPAGEAYDVVVGGPGKVLDHNGLELAFRDSRMQGGGADGRVSTAGKSLWALRRPSGSNAKNDVTPQSAPKDEWL